MSGEEFVRRGLLGCGVENLERAVVGKFRANEYNKLFAREGKGWVSRARSTGVGLGLETSAMGRWSRYIYGYWYLQSPRYLL